MKRQITLGKKQQDPRHMQVSLWNSTSCLKKKQQLKTGLKGDLQVLWSMDGHCKGHFSDESRGDLFPKKG